MTNLLRPGPPISATPADGQVVAGQPLDVTVRYEADPALEHHALEEAHGEVELIRTTAVTRLGRNWTGAGSKVSLRSSSMVSRAFLEIAGPLPAGQNLERLITLAVPPGEATITGKLVQQDYVVRARVRGQAGRVAEVDTVVRVVSAAPDRAWTADAAPVTKDAGSAVLGIEDLSTRRLSAGVPVVGVVTVAPLRADTARGVRVELVLDEHVPARPSEPLEEDCDATTVVSAVPLADHLPLQPGQVLRYPFTLPVPQRLPAPSVSTPDLTLRWFLRAVLDRSMRRDPSTAVELCGTTAT
jgi:hypothetical protein